VAQGLGYALTEELLFDEKGRMVTTSFRDYKIPAAADMPRLTTMLVESYEPHGPYGAKAVAEIPIDGPAPAVVNAIYDAVGVRLRSLPCTPEKVYLGLKEVRRREHEQVLVRT